MHVSVFGAERVISPCDVFSLVSYYLHNFMEYDDNQGSLTVDHYRC